MTVVEAQLQRRRADGVLVDWPLNQDGSEPVADAEARTHLAAISLALGGSATEKRLDYGTRSDGNPVYVGAAPNGAATSGAVWRITKFTYDASARLTRTQELRDQLWDNREALGW